MTQQIALFDFAPLPEATIWKRWDKDGPLLHKGAVHEHLLSGMTIHHCGHPTANFPYYILTHLGAPIYAPNGRGFQRLDLAKQHVEALHAEKENNHAPAHS